MPRQRPHFLLLILITGIFTQSRVAKSEEHTLGLTLEDLEERAITSYPEIEAARARLARLEAELAEVYWTPFDGLSVSGALAPIPERRGDALHVAQGDTTFSDNWGIAIQTQVRLELPLYTFGRLIADRDAARQDVVAGREEVRVAERETRAQVQRAYYALLLAVQSRSLLQEGEGYLDRANRYVDSRITEGNSEISEADRLQLQVVAAEVEARLSDANRAVRLATVALEMLCNLESDEEVITDTLEPREFELRSIDFYRERTLETHPELAVALARTSAAIAERRSARSQFFPELKLVGHLDYAFANRSDDQRSAFASDPFNHLRYEFGLQLAWNLDFMSDRARFHQAEARLREARAQEETIRREVSLEIDEAHITVEENQAVVAARRRGRRAARGWLVSIIQGIDVGVLDPPELVDALRGYFEQSFLYLEAVAELNASLDHLELVVGNGTLNPNE